jgi:asparagine synthase (glutamine-hydrolysing)
MRALGHRGPDAYGEAEHGRATFAFCRLAIVGVDDGTQPLFNERGDVCLVANGEIYNHRELRRGLEAKGHVFGSKSDCEVIVHLYEELGERCLEELRGMFAFLLHDLRSDTLFGALDRFGIKPLYYAETPHAFAAGSEAKALLDLPGCEGRLDFQALSDYLTFQYVPEPRTMFAGISKLPPGCSFLYRRNRLQITRYFTPRFEAVTTAHRDARDIEEELRALLRESVLLHAQAEVPVGAFLSGGIDSTIIAALLREIGPLRTFSLGYAESAYSELPQAAATARFLGTEHEEIIMGPEEFWAALPRAVWHLDDPVADPSAVALYALAREAGRHVTVALSGEGADELFGGYGIYREPAALAPLARLPHPLVRALAAGAACLPRGVKGRDYLLRGATTLRERYVGNARLLGEDAKLDLLALDAWSRDHSGGSRSPSSPLPATAVTSPLYDFGEKLAYDDITMMQHVDILSWLPGDILAKADRMTMAHSLELRVPFLDHEVFRLAASLPSHLRVEGSVTKPLLRRAFRNQLPPDAWSRPKRGFPVPTRKWLRGPLAKELTALLGDPHLGRYFNRREVEGMLRTHLSGRRDTSRPLFALAMFALWEETFLRTPAPRPSVRARRERTPPVLTPVTAPAGGWS